MPKNYSNKNSTNNNNNNDSNNKNKATTRIKPAENVSEVVQRLLAVAVVVLAGCSQEGQPAPLQLCPALQIQIQIQIQRQMQIQIKFKIQICLLPKISTCFFQALSTRENQPRSPSYTRKSKIFSKYFWHTFFFAKVDNVAMLFYHQDNC